MGFASGADDSGQASLGTGGNLPSALMDLLLASEIVPGSAPSYQLCKTIYSYHPLGAKMAEGPISMAQSQERIISIPGGPEEELIRAFNKEWKLLGKVGADVLIHNLMKISRIYGIGALIVGSRDYPTDEPLPMDRLHEMDLYFNVEDPLNTAGSLVLDQDPNAPDYQKPRYLVIGANKYHPSRSIIQMNEQPIYIEWTNSAFGFVGRSIYQRALYPMKSYVQSMITDNAITEKAALLVARLKSPGSIMDQRSRSWFGFKRSAIGGAKTGNVVSIGIDESVESIDLKNLRDAAEFARNNILKNIAAAAGQPASMINMETLAEGFGEGSEDAKQIAHYINRVRVEMTPAYSFFDNIVRRRAWSPAFYETMQRKYPQLASVPYQTAFVEWENAFDAQWPNLLVEPDSEKAKKEDVILKAAIGAVEVLIPMLDPVNKATAAVWLSDVINERKFMFSAPLNLDAEAIAEYVPPEPEKEPEAMPEGYES